MKKKWEQFEISFQRKSEEELRLQEKWLDEVFAPTSFRRVMTTEHIPANKVIITFEDTGARKP